jgi:hypothetical protein
MGSKTEGSKRETTSFAGAKERLPNASEPKTLLAPLRPLGSKPLPSIIGSTPLPALSLSALSEKKKQSEEALKRSQEQLAEQRRHEEALRSKVNAGADQAEIERRAQHMQQQRERLIAQKKAQREEKVRAEEDRKARKGPAATAADEAMLQDSVDRVSRGVHGASDCKSSTEDAEADAENRRAILRNALARRMKMELMETEEAKISQLQENQFSELDQKLKQVEQLREDNRKREFMMSKQMERQQAQIARNIKMSAAELQND